MPLDRESRIVGVHPFRIVLNTDQSLAAELHRDGDPARPRIERVLDELLHDRGGPLDDFARGNLVGEVGR